MRFLRVFGALSLSMASAFSQGGDYVVVPSLEFKWQVPSLRENRTVLPLAEIRGYELRWRLKGAKTYKSTFIRGGSNKSYLLAGGLNSLHEFEIATVDADGLYSSFVPIKYKLVSIRQTNANSAPTQAKCTMEAPCEVILGAGDVYVRKS